MRETRDAGKGRRVKGTREENRGKGKGYSSSSPKPSRAKKRNGRKTAFIKLSADVHTLPISPRLSLSSFAFHSAETRAFARAIPPPLTSPPATLFFSPAPIRNSWPPLLPPWNEVGMCKIVPRYALHHRVASSPSALFLPLAFFRFLLSSF